MHGTDRQICPCRMFSTGAEQVEKGKEAEEKPEVQGTVRSCARLIAGRGRRHIEKPCGVSLQSHAESLDVAVEAMGSPVKAVSHGHSDFHVWPRLCSNSCP